MRQHTGTREKNMVNIDNINSGLRLARAEFNDARYCEAFDIYEYLAASFPAQAIDILAELYDCYQQLPERSRYSLYQARLFDFGIKPGDKVLDIGSGHIPFPLSTHLADITLENHSYGRAGAPFKYIEGRPVYECSVEKMPFDDKEFDFVYCSHVLEHTEDPEQACKELMRVGKRGYIETPTRAKDILLNSAKISNHTRSVELRDDKLVFTDYSEKDIEGLQCDILLSMHCAPQTPREKAFAALVWLKADLFNTMLLWDNTFEYEVKRAKPNEVVENSVGSDGKNGISYGASGVHSIATDKPLKFLQVHTFYPSYLKDFYLRNPQLVQKSFDEQINALVRDGFSGIHIFAPYMAAQGYKSDFIVANNPTTQAQWLAEQGEFSLPDSNNWVHEIVRRQIETIKPDVLYLSDPITFDSRFVRTLSWSPSLILGWRAANIAPDTDWSKFDLMLSSLSALRKVALELGAKAAEHFFPGYPLWINNEIASVQPEYDVVFSGSWTTGQHPRRNQYLLHLAREAASPDAGFSCGFYINCNPDMLPPEIKRLNHGERFGVAMHAALRSGRIVVDARGILEYRNPATNAVSDLAKRETANMRIFEVTGSGRLLLTEYHDNLKEYFEPGVEIETFRDETELVEKIRYYLANPEKREAIARRGQERCLREYSMDKRAREFDAIIRKHLTAKLSPGANVVLESARLLEEARGCLSRGDLNKAFSLLIQAKATKEPVEGVDLVRARCFHKMDRVLEAMEALREELRYFPHNMEAQKFLAELEKQHQVQNIAIEDQEFQSILQVIRPYTMLSEQRLYSLFRLARHVCDQNIPGNFVECGVAAGGSSALLAWVIKKYSKHPRRLFAFDSFSGMPKPSAVDSHQGIGAESTGWGTGTCSAPESSVKELCSRLGVADVLTTVKGYFEETLPPMRNWVGMLALLHMDGDWYESTKAILANLYDRLSNGAVVQVDDYGYWEGCRKAIHEFESLRSLSFEMKPIDGTGVWFLKPDRFAANSSVTPELLDEFMQDDPYVSGIESQMSVNERFQLFWAVRNLLQQGKRLKRFIEIGSYSGASLFLICKSLMRLGGSFQGIAVEPGGTPTFYKVLDALQDHVLHFRMYSHDAAKRIGAAMRDGNQADFILVDGDHTYEGVYQDIENYYPFLAPGGIMLFHDWLPPLTPDNRNFILHHHAGQEPGIRRACEELMEQKYKCEGIELPLLYPTDPTQTQPHLPIIPGVFSTMRAYRKPSA